MPRTTSAAIAVSNFESRIDALERKVATDHEPSRVAELVDQLLARAQLLGRLRDYDEAESWATRENVSTEPGPATYLMRAKVHGALHRFDEASADLTAAEQHQAREKDTLPLRISLLSARGQWDKAMAMRVAHPPAHGDLLSLASEATLHAEVGQMDSADRLFDQAVREYRDVSPMPIAWIYFQRGLMHERVGDHATARRLYAVAHQILPQYAPATGHLAQMMALDGEEGAALELLEPLLATSDDPEYRGQAATLLLKTDPARAARLHDEARVSYAKLVERHPDAFADHAARFLLKDNPALALRLALRNLGLRQTTEAYDLALDASLAAGDAVQACRVAREAHARPHVPGRLIQRTAQVIQGC